VLSSLGLDSVWHFAPFLLPPRNWPFGPIRAPRYPSYHRLRSLSGPSDHTTEGRRGQEDIIQKIVLSSGVRTLSFASILAPRSSRSATVPVLPFRLASIRAVRPSYRGEKGSGRHNPKDCAVFRYTYVVFCLDVGPSLQQERHGVRLITVTSLHQGRHTFLRRVEVVRNT
jgi:hypothetical protein